MIQRVRTGVLKVELWEVAQLASQGVGTGVLKVELWEVAQLASQGVGTEVLKKENAILPVLLPALANTSRWECHNSL